MPGVPGASSTGRKVPWGRPGASQASREDLGGPGEDRVGTARRRDGDGRTETGVRRRAYGTSLPYLHNAPGARPTDPSPRDDDRLRGTGGGLRRPSTPPRSAAPAAEGPADQASCSTGRPRRRSAHAPPSCVAGFRLPHPPPASRPRRLPRGRTWGSNPLPQASRRSPSPIPFGPSPRAAPEGRPRRLTGHRRPRARAPDPAPRLPPYPASGARGGLTVVRGGRR